MAEVDIIFVYFKVWYYRLKSWSQDFYSEHKNAYPF